LILGGDLAVLQAPVFNGRAFDASALGEDGFIRAEVGVRWCHIAQTFVVAMVIIVLDERLDLGLDVAGQEVVFQQDGFFRVWRQRSILPWV
jgi:hypothetical protein